MHTYSSVKFLNYLSIVLMDDRAYYNLISYVNVLHTSRNVSISKNVQTNFTYDVQLIIHQ